MSGRRNKTVLICSGSSCVRQNYVACKEVELRISYGNRLVKQKEIGWIRVGGNGTGRDCTPRDIQFRDNDTMGHIYVVWRDGKGDDLK